MRKLLCVGTATLISAVLAAQPADPETEKGYIKAMCGCYAVGFKYAETFAESSDYEFHDRYKAGGLEWIFVDEESDTELVLQHLLVVSDSMIIKHWRQDWLYENQDLLVYQRNNEWSKKVLTPDEASGTWTQKVYQVADGPRYEGYSTWLNVNDRIYWESQVFAPLPRREFTKRSDYNVMLRNNKHLITDFGHVHEQDNAKVVRTESGDSVLVWEKGMNTYTRVEDSRCQPARDWWENNRRYWVNVRTVWGEVIAENDYINLKSEIDGKRLWQRLFELGDEYAEATDYRDSTARLKIRETIELYLSTTPGPWEANATLEQVK